MLHWIFLFEEYNPTIKYIKEPYNDTEDLFTKFLLINFDIPESEILRETLAESYCGDKLDSKKFPLTYQIMD